MNLYGLLDAIIGKVNRSVKVDTQELGETLQKQARDNISAVGKEEVCNPNLLTNWYFLNPVNQKGQTKYSAAGITIDRWGADGITTIESGVSSTSAFYQVVSDKFMQGLLGKTITLSALDNSNLVYTTFQLPDTLPADYVFVTKIEGDDILSVVLKAGNNSQLLRVTSGFNNLIAVKAEIGDTQTLAHQDSNGNWILNEIPKYEEELLKCRQYDPDTDKYIGLRKFSQPQNLLDNSDFTNPINSKNIADGATIPAYTNFIDRWGSHSATEETVYITEQGVDTSAHRIYQRMLSEKIKGLVGKQVTAAVKFYDGTLSVMSFILKEAPGNNQWTDSMSNLYMIVSGIQDSTIYEFIIQNMPSPIQWAALYAGLYTIDTLPEYQSKGYETELAISSQYNPISTIYKGAYSMDLLWANASPASDFAAQTLALDLQDYDFVVISCNYADGTNVYGTNFCPKGFKTGLSAIAYSSNLYIAMREATVDAAGITFGDGYRQSLNASSATKNAGNCIPITVYGVKGVG